MRTSSSSGGACLRSKPAEVAAAPAECDLAVVGGGILGLAVARELRRRRPRLDELERRGRANGVPGLRRLTPEGLRELEPHCRGVAALHSPATGIIDFGDVARALAGELAEAGTRVVTGCSVEGIVQPPRRIALVHAGGQTSARF